MSEPVSDDAALGRWMVIILARLGGAVMTVVGLLITAERLPAPQWIGYPLVFVGLFVVFMVPQLLARKWRSPSK
ncbi:hypothetical protein KK137_09595 [Croceibacterium sp. LX-88]|jgi:hypothetical protein|uniref:Uncharacterized protein n=1 Tax=Croceibacterium selenioxidans TaxID=2838833 RepID=A0ABS5W5H2_9SPHN|nr:hypothetical protein [Croceibacterium selenioxidans]MBT2134587.1 hypothetical protein [Croceibacterium selenioxidans]